MTRSKIAAFLTLAFIVLFCFAGVTATTTVKDATVSIEMGLPMVVESETCKPDGMTEAKICIEYLKSLEK